MDPFYKLGQLAALEKLALRGDPFLQQYSHIFSTNAGPTRAQHAIAVAKNNAHDAGMRMAQRRQVAAAGVPHQSPEWLALQSGWDHRTVQSPNFPQQFESVLKSASLRFENAQDAREHMDLRNTVGTIGGGIAGAGLGGMVGARRLGGSLGTPLGMGLGALAGAGAGRGLIDMMHDIPERTTRPYRENQERFNAAAGGNVRLAFVSEEEDPGDAPELKDPEEGALLGGGDVASHHGIAAAAPSAEDFAAFAKQDDTLEEGAGPGDLAHELDPEERMRPPGWGNDSSLDAQDTATRTQELGLPSFGGV